MKRQIFVLFCVLQKIRHFESLMEKLCPINVIHLATFLGAPKCLILYQIHRKASQQLRVDMVSHLQILAYINDINIYT